MRELRILLGLLLVFAGDACSPSSPPRGRWQGAYESQGVIIVTRLEIDPKGNIFLSAPDAMEIAGASPEDRVAIRRRLADELRDAWNAVAPKQFDFDGRTFRKPGGVAPQLEWDPDTRKMTVVVYLGMRAAIRIPLHAVADFKSDPWT